jgi:enterochelin esterase-like enzyme
MNAPLGSRLVGLIATLVLLGAQPTDFTSLQLVYFHSTIFDNTRMLRVLLPPGYDSTDQRLRRYPVLYLNDGQDLFDPRTSTFHNGSWSLLDRMERLYADRAIAPMIIVGIDNAGHRKRPNEYLPWPDTTLRPALPQPHGKNYPSFVVHEVMPYVQTHFRTLTAPRYTGIGGASYGALIAIYTVGREPGRFGRLLIESPSVYPDNYHLIRVVQSMPIVPRRISIGIGTNEDGAASCTLTHPAGEELQDVLRLRAAFLSASRGRSKVLLDVVTCAKHEPGAFGARFPAAIEFLYGKSTP